MSAMPAAELPENAAELLDEPADLLVILAAVQPTMKTVPPTMKTLRPVMSTALPTGTAAPPTDSAAPPTESTAQPGQSASRRAAARWAQRIPATAPPAPSRGQAAARPAPSRGQTAAAPARNQTAGLPLRLTRRGRIVAAAVTVVLLGTLSLIAALSAQATSQAPARTGRSVTQVTVRPGQSLWSVAENADPSADTRAVVQQIVELNSLTGSAVFAGQRLWVPRG